MISSGGGNIVVVCISISLCRVITYVRTRLRFAELGDPLAGKTGDMFLSHLVRDQNNFCQHPHVSG